MTAIALSRPGRTGRTGGHRWVLVGLVAVTLIPLVSGVLRVIQLAGGPELMPAEPRFATSAAPIVTHVVASLVFAVVGALQFVPRLRRPGVAWHRRAGRVVAVAGLISAGSALWLTLFVTPKPGTGHLLFGLRLAFASAMIGCLVLAIAAVRGRDFVRHRAWMMRGYAIGVAAGTQALTEGLSRALFGSGMLLDDLAKGMGWVINLTVAELIIRKPRRARRPAAATMADPTSTGSDR